MTFVVRLGVRERPQPVFRTADGCRWEYQCSWCEAKFEHPAQLVKHVRKERDR